MECKIHWLLIAHFASLVLAGHPSWFLKKEFQCPVVIKLPYWWAIYANCHAGCEAVTLQPTSQVCLDLHTEKKKNEYKIRI